MFNSNKLYGGPKEVEGGNTTKSLVNDIKSKLTLEQYIEIRKQQEQAKSPKPAQPMATKPQPELKTCKPVVKRDRSRSQDKKNRQAEYSLSKKEVKSEKKVEKIDQKQSDSKKEDLSMKVVKKEDKKKISREEKIRMHREKLKQRKQMQNQ